MRFLCFQLWMYKFIIFSLHKRTTLNNSQGSDIVLVLIQSLICYMLLCIQLCHEDFPQMSILLDLLTVIISLFLKIALMNQKKFLEYSKCRHNFHQQNLILMSHLCSIERFSCIYFSISCLQASFFADDPHEFL